MPTADAKCVKALTKQQQTSNICPVKVANPHILSTDWHALELGMRKANLDAFVRMPMMFASI